MGAVSVDARMSALMLDTLSASREMGTHTSVVHTLHPSRMFCAAHSATLRASHRRSCLDGSRSHWKEPPLYLRIVVDTRLDASSTCAGVPEKRKKRCGFSAYDRPLFMLTARIMTSSSSSTHCTWVPWRIRSPTALHASPTSSNAHTATALACGMGCNRSVASTTTPSVPSLPTNSDVKSYPADVLRARCAVFTSVPSGSTTLSAKTFCFMVP
mmetsp:Transcript_11032/g.35118  ORF Transcript_11032/g.35118 Transcript_11032/m.35118 type:complete len:213 (-) Transcript_11032:662-1300(-)